MNKAALLTALTALHEKPVDLPAWGITGVLLREFTARERQYAQEAVQAETPADPDQILYRAMLLQRCLTDPDTGQPYTDGRTGIDPRTRTPVFSVEDIAVLADARAILFNLLWDNLLELAALGPQAMFSGGSADVSGERDQGASAEGVGDGAGRYVSTRFDGLDERGEVVSGSQSENGDAGGGNAG